MNDRRFMLHIACQLRFPALKVAALRLAAVTLGLLLLAVHASVFAQAAAVAPATMPAAASAAPGRRGRCRGVWPPDRSAFFTARSSCGHSSLRTGSRRSSARRAARVCGAEARTGRRSRSDSASSTPIRASARATGSSSTTSRSGTSSPPTACHAFPSGGRPPSDPEWILDKVGRRIPPQGT